MNKPRTGHQKNESADPPEIHKHPFTIRVSPDSSERFRVITTVLDMDSAVLFDLLMEKFESEHLSETQRSAVEVLLKVRKEQHK